MDTVVVVDGANVVGSVPDGWWRDRPGAARRLRDALAPVPAAGLPGAAGPVEVILVVEGPAAVVAGEQPPAGVTVVAPPGGTGDDAIVRIVAADQQRRRVVVVTADRGLRERVRALGAEVIGPRTLPYGTGRTGGAGQARSRPPG